MNELPMPAGFRDTAPDEEEAMPRVPDTMFVLIGTRRKVTWYATTEAEWEDSPIYPDCPECGGTLVDHQKGGLRCSYLGGVRITIVQSEDYLRGLADGFQMFTG